MRRRRDASFPSCTLEITPTKQCYLRHIATNKIAMASTNPHRPFTKAARNWLGNKLDATKRSQIMFMDRDDILNLYVVTNLPLPAGAIPTSAIDDDDIPF
jgi:hypothetical protein